MGKCFVKQKVQYKNRMNSSVDVVLVLCVSTMCNIAKHGETLRV